MKESKLLYQTKRVATGLAFIIFPLFFIFAFAVHPDLLHPHFLNPQELILRAHGNSLLQFGHVLVTLSTGLLIVVALHLKNQLEHRNSAWAGLIGAVLAIFGTIILAADKGAMCLTMSALDTLPETEFVRMMPGLLAIFSKEGWMVLLWGIVCLPIGFAIQAIAMIKSGVLSRWQSILFLMGAILIATPDGVEIINLTASILMAAALIPYGIRLIVRPRQCKKLKWPDCSQNCKNCTID